MKIAEVRQRMVECMRLQRLSPATVKASPLDTRKASAA